MDCASYWTASAIIALAGNTSSRHAERPQLLFAIAARSFEHREAIGLQRLFLTANDEGWQRHRIDGMFRFMHRIEDAFAHQDFANARTCGEARGDIHGVTDQRVAHVIGRADVAGDDLAAIEADAQADSHGPSAQTSVVILQSCQCRR